MGLGKKLFVVVFGNVLITLALALFAYWEVNELDRLEHLAIESGKAIHNHMQGDMMHDALRGDVLRALLIAATSDSRIGTKDDVLTDLKEHTETFFSAIKSNQELELPTNVKAGLEAAISPLNAYIKSADSIVNLAFSAPEEARAALIDFNHSFSELEGKLESLSDDLSALGQETEKTLTGKTVLAERLLIGAGILSLLVGALLVYVTNRSSARVLLEMTTRLQELSAQLFRSSDQVSAGAHGLAQGASEQAASLEETAATMEEVSSMAKHNAANAQQANILSKAVNTSSDQGAAAMREMRNAIDSIQVAADETAQIIRTIDEIAFQTNLLALNAAVEAARAGEVGKGFAVVAEEVRTLAQRSANAARETTEKIRRSKELAENGVNVSRIVEKYLEEIRLNSGKALETVNEITGASQEQSTGLSQLSTTMAELDKVTQSNAAAAEESSAAGSDLADQAGNLERVVRELVLLVVGHAKQDGSAMKSPSNANSGHKEARTSTKIFSQAPVESMLEPTRVIPLDDSDLAAH